MKHSPDIYIAAFETYCDSGRYSEVARQMGVSASTAKRWVRIGGQAWRERHSNDIKRQIANDR
jgi:transposase-like protein